jgi:hypothetical protein
MVSRRIWGNKVDAEPSGLRVGTIDLDDGRTVAAMVADAGFLSAEASIEDITAYRGWRAYVAARGLLAEPPG